MARASQTFKSGKLNEVIDTFVGEVDAASGGSYQRRVEGEPSLGPNRLGLLDGSFDACEDQMPGGASLPCGGFVKAPMKVGRQIDTGANRVWLHKTILRSAT